MTRSRYLDPDSLAIDAIQGKQIELSTLKVTRLEHRHTVVERTSPLPTSSAQRP